METIVPAGTVTPLENVNGRNARRLEGTREKRRAYQDFTFRVPRRESESNERVMKLLSRRLSRRKLSTLCILSIPAFVQPSSLITASTSSRRGLRYSGLSRRPYRTCVAVYGQAVIRNVLQIETEHQHLP
jgi:hypothetical protein